MPSNQWPAAPSPSRSPPPAPRRSSPAVPPPSAQVARPASPPPPTAPPAPTPSAPPPPASPLQPHSPWRTRRRPAWWSRRCPMRTAPMTAPPACVRPSVTPKRSRDRRLSRLLRASSPSRAATSLPPKRVAALDQQPYHPGTRGQRPDGAAGRQRFGLPGLHGGRGGHSRSLRLDHLRRLRRRHLQRRQPDGQRLYAVGQLRH